MVDEEKTYGVVNPNEGDGRGNLASNMTGEELDEIFDYGSITDRDKKVVKEIIDLLRNRINIPVEMIIEELKTKFTLEEIPMQKIEDSVWGQLTKNERLGQSIQGFRETTDEDGKKIRIPHVAFSADLDYLDEFVNRIVERVNKIKQ